jgi:hypothetical protein
MLHFLCGDSYHALTTTDRVRWLLFGQEEF